MAVPFQPVRFGKYFLLDKVAVGGMAEIFRAKSFGHSGFEKVVVIKRILREFASNEDFVEMFIDEAKLSVELTHPNIVQIYDFGKIEDSFFIAMESVQGKDLRSVLRRQAERGEFIPFEVSAFIAHEMACGLDFAHKKTDHIGLPLNIVHRDISPSNVLVSYGGHVKVLDFGIAKADSAADSTESGVLKGKFQYMSPEQAMAAPIDHRSDIFSLGICLWEMLTGNRLFKRNTGLESLDAVRSGEVPTPTSFNPTVPPELERICMRALSHDPGARYQEACQMQADLQHFMQPHTPSSLAPHVSTWLRGRFGEEILRERERLDRGTQLVAGFKGGEDLTFNGSQGKTKRRRDGSNITHGRRRKKKKQSTNWLLLAGASIVLLLTLLLVGLLVAPAFIEKRPNSGLGTVVIDISPSGLDDVEILFDGQPIRARYDQVKPGVPHKLVVTAPGHKSRVKSGIELEAGQVYRIEVDLIEKQISSLDLGGAAEGSAHLDKHTTLSPNERPLKRASERQSPDSNERASGRSQATKLPDKSARTAPNTPTTTGPRGAFLDPSVGRSSDANAPPVIAFRSEPSAARVFIDGRRQGTTPFAWANGEPRTLYKVEFRKDGYRSVQAAINSPAKGHEVVVERSLERKSEGNTGTLSISVSAGYARVFIDGEFVNTTPLVGFELRPGKHEVRIANPLEELDRTETVTVRTGRHTNKVFDVSP